MKISRLIDVYTHPHAIEAALKSRPRDVVQLCVVEGEPARTYAGILSLAEEGRVEIVNFRSHQHLLDHLRRPDTEGLRNIAAFVYRYELRSFEESLKKLADSPIKEPQLLLMLDSLSDPQNVGAILRTAHGLGADVVLFPQRRTAPITATVANVAVGAIEKMQLIEVVNLNRAVEKLKEEGYWTVGLVVEGGGTFDQIPEVEKVVLVIGSEGKGVRPSIAKPCDFRVTIPMRRADFCLNASVAAGIALYEMSRKIHLLTR
ncbi:MAG: 23S rRNA (guanosine(2251)-2'-O)-methyltransferase RlmB [Deltaproteobacteria bacterium]|nr:23S rRNA (guanosine(2251)-2'-O)-methyltransferase RlmB [Deltaproteobacteria bacterium]